MDSKAINRFSLVKFFQYFIIPQLLIVLMLTVVIFLIEKDNPIIYLLFVGIVFLVVCLWQIVIMQPTFIDIESDKMIYRHKNNLIKIVGQKLGIFNRDEHNYSDYQFNKITDISFRFNYLVIKGQIVKRSYAVYMDDDEEVVEKLYQEIKIPRVYCHLEQLADSNFLLSLNAGL